LSPPFQSSNPFFPPPQTLSLENPNPRETYLKHPFSLTQSAKDGYRSYLQAYASHSLRSVFDVHKLDLVKVAKGFGFTTPPRVDIQLGAGMSRDRRPGGSSSARRAYGSQPKVQRGGARFKR
jgi:ATP-dependent RNA helicase DDX18/HAS1